MTYDEEWNMCNSSSLISPHLLSDSLKWGWLLHIMNARNWVRSGGFECKLLDIQQCPWSPIPSLCELICLQECFCFQFCDVEWPSFTRMLQAVVGESTKKKKSLFQRILFWKTGNLWQNNPFPKYFWHNSAQKKWNQWDSAAINGGTWQQLT